MAEERPSFGEENSRRGKQDNRAIILQLVHSTHSHAGPEAEDEESVTKY